jgi:hypothetical protein
MVKPSTKTTKVLVLLCVSLVSAAADAAGVLYFRHARLAKASPANSSAEVGVAEVRGPEPKSCAAPEKTVTVDKLLADYKSSAVNAAREYEGGKRIGVAGAVQDIARSPNGGWFVRLQPMSMPGAVLCELSEFDEDVPRLYPGRFVTLSGVGSSSIPKLEQNWAAVGFEVCVVEKL